MGGARWKAGRMSKVSRKQPDPQLVEVRSRHDVTLERTGMGLFAAMTLEKGKQVAHVVPFADIKKQLKRRNRNKEGKYYCYQVKLKFRDVLGILANATKKPEYVNVELVRSGGNTYLKTTTDVTAGTELLLQSK